MVPKVKTLQGRRRGYSAKYLERKIDEAYEKAATVAETIYGTRFHSPAERRTGNKIALNIRALKGKPQ